MNYELLLGDAVQVMRGLPANSVQCAITSPPYFGLRDYGTATWEGGDAECDHVAPPRGGRGSSTLTSGGSHEPQERYIVKLDTAQYRSTCGKCGARRVDNQIGLEETPEAYVAKLVEVFREVRRILHPSGVVWLNLGDSYNGSGGSTTTTNFGKQYDGVSGSFTCQPRNVNGLKPKDLCMIPARVAIALQDDGWWLRQEIVWHKKSCMPESVQDRCTRAHEMVYMLAKNASYYYDAEAIKEPNSETSAGNRKSFRGGGAYTNNHSFHNSVPKENETHGNSGELNGRNKRSVWTLGPESYSGAHFATMPTKLVEPCILAGTSAYGCCAKCLAPWARVVEREAQLEQGRKSLGYGTATDAGGFTTNGHGKSTLHHTATSTTTGWQPTCQCNADVVPCTVLDCFAGSGTTLAVALKHGRRAIGIDLNADYLELAHRRIQQSQPLLFALEVTP